MGTWGSGNFENDGALDYLSQVASQLVTRIEQVFENDVAQLDEDGEWVLMPSVQILSVLHERRKMIEAIFEKLEQQAREFWQVLP
jgi:hypothetical protein